MHRYPLVKWLLLGSWLAYLIYNTRYAMLDDALIHLRYAGFLQQLHRITYDGVHFSYGTSSLLYVSLLALLRNVTSTVMLPKAASVVCYLLLIGVLCLLGRRLNGTAPQAVWLGLLLTALSPMGIRWLTDGMETSLVILMVTLLAWAVSREADGYSGALAYPLFVLFGAVLVFLRIELASLAMLGTCIVMASRLERSQGELSKMRQVLRSTGLGMGALLALATVRQIFGSVLPDTALAKSGVPSLGALGGSAHVILSSMLLGVGAVLLYFVSCLLVLRELVQKRASFWEFAAWSCANASFPLIIFLACVRGQSIQGIRYILWPLFFAVVWNVLALERLARQLSEENRERHLMRGLLWAYPILFLCLVPLDWHFAMRAMHGRAKTFISMRDAGLSRFRDKTVVAGDVGFIGYFTGGSVCDMDGLVNGLAAARLKPAQRVANCAALHPDLLFVTESQAHELSRSMELTEWKVCQQFDFVNIGGNDRHYLMLPAAKLLTVAGNPGTCM